MTNLVTPSRPDYWTGTLVAGEGMTREQQAAQKSRARELDTAVRRYDLPHVYVVVRLIQPKRLEEIATKVSYPCPVLGSSRDRRSLKVIAPNGMETWTEWKR